VWIKVNPRGEPAAGPDGRVEMLYKPGGKVYRASSRNLEPDPNGETLSDSAASAGDAAPDKGTKPAKGKAKHAAAAAPLPDSAIIVYTDGACTGNPGPMGIGVVILDGSDRQEISEYLGQGTNNIAELTAIVRALEKVSSDRTVVIHSDSAYALGLLGKGWKAKANQELVARLRRRVAAFAGVTFVKVAGHAGVPENERCDELARGAIETRGRR
jgi:ribonuclease HI